MEKPKNPETLDDNGRAKLYELDGQYLVYPFLLGTDWNGEPIELPANFYAEESSPSGFSLLGWRLTSDGISAWESLKSE